MSRKTLDTFGNRMKTFYENRYKYFLPRRSYSIIRLDGKSFHTYTKNLERPFDVKFIEDMNLSALFLARNIQGAKFVYTQSDEISILITDFDTLETGAWFDNSIQKISSVSSSILTAKFNELRPGKLAFFDCRAFSIPSREEVKNYFIWRQKDHIRNSIQMLGQYNFSHAELRNKNSVQIKQMLSEKNIYWDMLHNTKKYGSVLYRSEIGEWVIDYPESFTGNSNNLLDTHIPIY